MKIPGMSFSLKRAVGVSAVKQKIATKTGIPTSKLGGTGNRWSYIEDDNRQEKIRK